MRLCRPITAKTIPKGEAWQHELKLNGHRFQIAKGRRRVRLYDQSGYEWTERLPGFTGAFGRLPCTIAVLDGELLLPDAEFGGLEIAVRAADEWELVYFAFDLLVGDGQDIRRLPLVERKRRLARLVGRAQIPCLHLVQTFDDGAKLLAAASQHELEGIVAKRRDAPYRAGACRDWRKVMSKCCM
jgi:bifunctional non-homologous end joining protein LigD